MNILIDIGNTRIKWGVDENGTIKSGNFIDYKQTDFRQQIKQQWLQLKSPDKLAISSVSAKHISLQLIEIAKTIWPDIKVVMAKSSANAYSVTNAYKNTEKLGVDRWLGLIALLHYYPESSCIVDCGTAITIDFLGDNGLHLGGLISPGLQLMKQSLYQGTENLSLNGQNFSEGLGNTTGSAIFTGTLYAAAGLIEKAINNYSAFKTLVMTGGDAELLSKHIKFESIIEPHFVLKGLSLFCSGEKEK